MIGNRVCFFQTIASTNDYLKQNLSDHTSGDLIVARIQTAGRGRRDRHWVSRDGNLHTSLLLEVESVKWTDFDVVMRTSLAVVHALDTFGVISAIKYPNDIVVGTRKIAGILIEKTKNHYIVGIGINVTLDDGTSYAFHPTSIYLETGRLVDYRDVLSAFIEAFNALIDVLDDVILEQYKTLSRVLNNDIAIDDTTHLVVDITKDGSLRLDHLDGPLVQPNEVTLQGWYDDK